MYAPNPPVIVPNSVAFCLPTVVCRELTRMSTFKQEEFLEEYRLKACSISITYILWLLLGWHYAHLGQWNKQWLF